MKKLLERHEELAATRPDEPGIVYAGGPAAGRTLTWGGLVARAEEIGRRLAALGAREGCVSALVLTDHPDLVPTLLALWRLDSPPVLLDPQWGTRLRDSILAHSTPSFLVTMEPSTEVTALRPDTAPDAPRDAAFIGYTSGSTGDPKAIVFSQERLYAGTLGNCSASERLHGHRPARLARSMRMSGSGVINLHHTWSAVLGATLVVLPELTVETARDYWARVEHHGVEQTFLVPQLIELVNRFGADRDHAARGPLCFTGSGPLAATTQERFQRRFGIPLYNAYGLSETHSAAFFGHRGADGLATNSVGVPERATARLRDSDGHVVADGADGEGEVELSGDQVFDGYFRNPEATAATLVDGWLRTGDVARRHEGRYYIVGRTKDVVMKGSYAIYLSEVEEAANAHPEVLESAAVALRQGESSEDIGCLVRPVAGAAPAAEDVLAWLRDALGPQRAPTRVVLTDQPLPRGGQDKLDRPGVTAVWDALPGVPRSSRGAWAKAHPVPR